MARIAASALAFSSPAAADVILPGPPVVPIRIGAAQIARMEREARDAPLAVFDLSRTGRPACLDETYRAAGAKGIVGIDRIVGVTVIGYRAFLLDATGRRRRSARPMSISSAGSTMTAG